MAKNGVPNWPYIMDNAEALADYKDNIWFNEVLTPREADIVAITDKLHPLDAIGPEETIVV